MIKKSATKTAFVALLSALAVSAAVVWGFFDSLELRALDSLFALRGATVPQAPITIVDIDDDTLSALGMSWPLPRKLHGEVLERLGGAGATVIGLDLVFSTPSAHGEADDAAFAQSVRRVHGVVLAAAPTRTVV